MKACVIFNPVAKGDKARKFRQHLDAIARMATLASTTCAGDARRLAAKAVSAGFDTVVAAGGDGTLNEVLNGMGDVPGGFEKARLGVLPLGTVNVFARELGISTNLEAAWAAITQGASRQVDLPAVRQTQEGQERIRYFAQLAGAGFDARAIELTDWSLKKRIGPLAYVVAGLKCMSGEPCGMVVRAGDQILEGQLVLIGNGRLYGGKYPIFDQADLNDGLLDVAVFAKVSWPTLLRCAPSLLLGRSLPAGAVRRLKVPRVELSSVARAPLQVDGELAGTLPAVLEMSGKKLRVIR